MNKESVSRMHSEQSNSLLNCVEALMNTFVSGSLSNEDFCKFINKNYEASIEEVQEWSETFEESVELFNEQFENINITCKKKPLGEQWLRKELIKWAREENSAARYLGIGELNQSIACVEEVLKDAIEGDVNSVNAEKFKDVALYGTGTSGNSESLFAINEDIKGLSEKVEGVSANSLSFCEILCNERQSHDSMKTRNLAGCNTSSTLTVYTKKRVEYVVAMALKLSVSKGMISFIPKKMPLVAYVNLACWSVESILVAKKVCCGEVTSVEALEHMKRVLCVMVVGCIKAGLPAFCVSSIPVLGPFLSMAIGPIIANAFSMDIETVIYNGFHKIRQFTSSFFKTNTNLVATYVKPKQNLLINT